MNLNDYGSNIFSCIKRARKLLSIRLFDDAAGKRWQKCVKDEQMELLCVSQFTLYNRLKGNKPDFHLAMQGPDASHLYNLLLDKLKQQYVSERIKGKATTKFKLNSLERLNKNYILDGKFGAMMQVHIQNDGPVTIEIESPRDQPKTQIETNKTE